MRPPRVRFTVRRMMVLVAIAGLLIGWGIESGRREERFRTAAREHWYASFGRAPDVSGQMSEARLRWHDRMAGKYERASRYPWLPIGPDSTRPE
jgi:hypothetical protein